MRAELLWTHTGLRWRRRGPLADESRDRARVVAPDPALLAPHVHIRSSGRAGVLCPIRIPPVPAPNRIHRGSKTKRAVAADGRAACSDNRINRPQVAESGS